MITRKISTNPRPTANAAMAIVEDWLAANSIDEMIPEKPTVEVDNTLKRIIYRAFKFEDDERGHEAAKLLVGHSYALIEDRIVPLLAPLTPIVRDAFQELEDGEERSRITLVEVTGRSSRSTKNNSFADRANRFLAKK
jgi:hypothetical protein